MVNAALSISAPAPASPAAAASQASHPSFFHQLLSELNPLQYVPVVGTIYRAITGDTIPESARIAGSMVVSGLMGGPIGIATNIGVTLLEQVTGIDPEKLGSRLLANLGIGSPAEPAAPAHQIAASPDAAAGAAIAETAPNPPNTAWSSAQYRAYDVARLDSGALPGGAVSEADVLNTAELARITLAG